MMLRIRMYSLGHNYQALPNINFDQQQINVKQILATYFMDDAIWDNTNPCNVSLDDINGIEALTNID